MVYTLVTTNAKGSGAARGYLILMYHYVINGRSGTGMDFSGVDLYIYTVAWRLNTVLRLDLLMVAFSGFPRDYIG